MLVRPTLLGTVRLGEIRWDREGVAQLVLELELTAVIGGDRSGCAGIWEKNSSSACNVCCAVTAGILTACIYREGRFHCGVQGTTVGT